MISRGSPTPLCVVMTESLAFMKMWYDDCQKVGHVVVPGRSIFRLVPESMEQNQKEQGHVHIVTSPGDQGYYSTVV